MKKVFGILLLLLILTLPSCDFLRKSAGRPTSDELALKKELASLRRQALEDSLLQERLIREMRRTNEDSIEAERYLKSVGINISDVFSFGTPLNPPLCRYSLIIGVFRSDDTVKMLTDEAALHGYQPVCYDFEAGVKAVCLAEDDNIANIAAIVRSASGEAFFPAGAWIYEVR